MVLLLRLDLTVPRDRPVRFNRIRNKVFVYEHAFSMNSFEIGHGVSFEWSYALSVRANVQFLHRGF